MRQIEIFSTGCAFCVETIVLIRRLTAGCCEIVVRNVREEEPADRARKLGLRSFPAVVVDGEVVPFDLFAALSRLVDEWDWPGTLGTG
jgi:glutaredoxin 3